MQPEVLAGSVPVPSSSPRADLLVAVIPQARTAAIATAAASGRIFMETDTCIFPSYRFPVPGMRNRRFRLDCAVEPVFHTPVFPQLPEYTISQRGSHAAIMSLKPSHRAPAESGDDEVVAGFQWRICAGPGLCRSLYIEKPGPRGRCPGGPGHWPGRLPEVPRLFGPARVVVQRGTELLRDRRWAWQPRPQSTMTSAANISPSKSEPVEARVPSRDPLDVVTYFPVVIRLTGESVLI